MPNHDRATDPHDQPPESSGPLDSTIPALDLAAALGGLDRATRNFNRRLGEPRRPLRPAATGSDARAPRAPMPEPRPAPQRRLAADDAFSARLLEAEREARDYLERAKQRADSLVTSMVRAVEQQAGEIRREAEEGMRVRWQQVETDAGRHLAEARRLSDGMVAERQHRIAVLSDGITRRAETLTTGLADVERVRMQFDVFVRALSLTADRIAADPQAPGIAVAAAGEIHDLRQPSRPSALAA